MDDPLTLTDLNITPSWGNIGQVVGCQNDLEVGDALTGNAFTVTNSTNHFTYHPQDLGVRTVVCAGADFKLANTLSAQRRSRFGDRRQEPDRLGAGSTASLNRSAVALPSLGLGGRGPLDCSQ